MNGTAFRENYHVYAAAAGRQGAELGTKKACRWCTPAATAAPSSGPRRGAVELTLGTTEYSAPSRRFSRRK
jgi:hypothetical protein